MVVLCHPTELAPVGQLICLNFLGIFSMSHISKSNAELPKFFEALTVIFHIQELVVLGDV